jgi:RNA polymerase sigma factor (sigma-70 family)
MASNLKTTGATDWLPTRQSLLIRLKDWKDSASWQEFFDRYWRLIYGVALRSGLTESEAQEVVQETMVTTSKKMPDFRYDPALGSFKGWLLHITHWRITDQLRKRRRDSVMVREEPTTEDRTSLMERIPDPAGLHLEALWEEEWQKNLTEVAIERVKSQVSPKQYQIFDLYVVKKWPMERISSSLGVNVGQIYLAKHRIGNLLKKEIRHLQEQAI